MKDVMKPGYDERLQTQLRSVFGYDRFRPDQLPIMNHVLEGNDCLVIMPTGGGKSMCYQLPALISEGLTLVISPLIALMADQVSNLRGYNVEANYINSSLSSAEKQTVFRNLENGKIRLLYISPEKAVMPRFIQYIKQKKIDLLAIDEAHCISIWGNDFRPVYAQLTQLMRELPRTPVMALTATADKATQQDICQKLDMKNPRVFLSSFERPNIHLQVRPAQGRLQQINAFLKQHKNEAGIIYCLSRKSTEEIAEKLRATGYRAAYYHAELESGRRKKVQEAFQKDELQIVCATIAFGMGIDKSNIRWVIHYNLPKNIESYYQEIGRSGRDGSPAEALLFYNFQDINIFRKFIDESESGPDFKAVQHQKLDRIWEFTQATNCRTNLILNYFGEYREKPCMHCDICTHPPKGFDGSQIVKHAIAACKESDETINLGMLVDILRASGRKDIFTQGLNDLRSYGAGREISRIDWIHFVTQMINQGLLMIDYTQHSNLRLTSLSDDILLDKRKIKLTKPLNYKTKQPELKPLTKNETFDVHFMSLLKDWRKNQAVKEKLPAYVIFNDRVLQQIVADRPTTLMDLINISGIGDYKLEKYGQSILRIVQDFINQQEIIKNVKGGSHLESLAMLRQGLSPEQIAKQRGIKRDRVYDHLTELYIKGEDINLHQFISEPMLHEVIEAWRLAKKSFDPALITEYIQTPYPIYKIQVALAIIKKTRQK
ncbi:MAG: DNA helicase RecQ [Saprospiraceae bacterium]|nr:DNA helicase RecQ [Saprospiraceae bacterium]